MTELTHVANVVSVTPQLVQIEITSRYEYEQLPQKLAIGTYVRVFTEGGPSLVAMVRSFRAKDITPRWRGNSTEGAVADPVSGELDVAFVVDTEPIGVLDEGGIFRRGSGTITIPPQQVEMLAPDALQRIYGQAHLSSPFSFGTLVQYPSVEVVVDGDRFFGGHVGVVGSTGSGKSGTVAKILQLGVAAGVGGDAGILNNSHIIILDLHGEYPSAFAERRVLSVDSLALPYWLMNSEELVDMFIESNEENSYNQVSQFRQAVLENKKRHAILENIDPATITYDSPVFFDLEQVVNYLANQNMEIIYRGDEGDRGPKLADGNVIADPNDYYFDKRLKFTPAVSSGAKKATIGPFYGEFSRFVMRLDARLADDRLQFLLRPKLDGGEPPHTADREELLRSFFGYRRGEESNLTIFDLSGVPFEVLSIVVSLLSRLVFDFKFRYRRARSDGQQECPVLIVLEEAHNYVPRDESARFRSVKRSIERIAKEGRKCGISLMVVSQRPSEVSETIFSQCGNFVAMRLTNPSDQQYVKRLLPDSLGAVTDSLPVLQQQEAILIGDSVSIPSAIRVGDLKLKPDSRDVLFLEEWSQEWLDLDFSAVYPSGVVAAVERQPEEVELVDEPVEI